MSWTYPAINPHAVAHTLLYRGPSIDFEQAVQREVVKGSSFYDQIDPVVATEYYYWIKIVSVNGTEGELLGPVSALAQRRSSQVLDDLDGLITKELLDSIIKAELAAIALLEASIADEINTRLLDNQTLQALLAQVEAGMGEAMTFLTSEVTQRTSADEALVQMIDAMAASIDGNLAAIIEERIVRATADSVMAANISTLFGNFNTAMAAIIQETSLRVSADEAVANSLTMMTARLDDLEEGGSGQISFEEFAEVKADVTGLSGQWAIKMQTNDVNNPVIAGIALAVEDPVAGPGASALVFMADKVTFKTLNGRAEPFSILGNQLNIGGDAIFTGTLHIQSGTSGNRTEMTNDKIQIFSNGALRVKIGNLG